MHEEQQKTIRLLDLDKAEQSRLEQTDAFKELVAMNKQKQSVNRPQQVQHCTQASAATAKFAAHVHTHFERRRQKS